MPPVLLDHLLDHLWQSTLFALGAALLVLALRSGPAAVRHGLWVAASVKFLIPFAALAALGGLLAPDIRLPAPAAAQAAMLKTAAQPFSQAFSRPAPSSGPSPSTVPATQSSSSTALAEAPFAAAPTPASRPTLRLDPVLILLFAWALGSLAILARWAARWTRLRRAMAAAKPVAWPAPMPVKASPWLIEPGLAGLLKPVLIVPETLPERLTRSEIEAIVAHEACHLRRKDNVTAALHMLVEALFWFHPLVWWIGRRLIVERERACDEAVVRAGHDRAAYARSLLESCRHYLQSPLDCMAGASGPDLKTRVEAIMTAPLAAPLAWPKKALLVAAGACAFATPVMAGLLTPEARKAVAPLARAVAAIAAPTQALGVGPDEATLGQAPPIEEAAPQPTLALARDSRVRASGLSVTAVATASQPLAQDAAAPASSPAPQGGPINVSADAASVNVPPAEPSSSPQAGLAPPAPTPAASSLLQRASLPSADFSSQASDFVRANARVGEFGYTVRWERPLCLQVEGLTPEQNAAVASRIDAVAQTLSQKVYSSLHQMCAQKNVWVWFTSDPQRDLDRMAAKDPRILGDAHSHTRGIKTVTQPVQVWRQTICFWTSCRPDPVAEPPLFARVLVDARRVDTTKLGVIADYLAMLVLADPRDLDHCQVLPSVLDLFAGPCPGRSAPSGLTRSDLAYLKALYTAGSPITQRDWNWAEHGGSVDQITGRMSMLLAGHGTLITPGAKPERRD